VSDPAPFEPLEVELIPVDLDRPVRETADRAAIGEFRAGYEGVGRQPRTDGQAAQRRPQVEPARRQRRQERSRGLRERRARSRPPDAVDNLVMVRDRNVPPHDPGCDRVLDRRRRRPTWSPTRACPVRIEESGDLASFPPHPANRIATMCAPESSCDAHGRGSKFRHPMIWVPSRSGGLMGPGGDLVVAGSGSQRAVEDSRQAIAELAQFGVMAGTAGGACRSRRERRVKRSVHRTPTGARRHRDVGYGHSAAAPRSSCSRRGISARSLALARRSHCHSPRGAMPPLRSASELVPPVS
jgi:hypothetical protein